MKEIADYAQIKNSVPNPGNRILGLQSDVCPVLRSGEAG
jgi:hypothetical protein